jgi:catechol 2,3-dioxygenase-like lactoylglutathione lyase family enzyme
MSVIKIVDIAFVRFQAPYLEKMRGFLDDFGLVTIPRHDGVLYARGYGPSPFVHATALGDAGFAGLGLRAASIDDLHVLANAQGVAVESFEAPGGGFVVRLSDPDNNLVEVVAGQTEVEPLPVNSRPPANSAFDKQRISTTKRLDKTSSHVMRLGHAVLNVSNFRASEAWYKERFGLITSDEVALSPDFSLGAFLRCDRGVTPTDHHTLFLLQGPDSPGLNHAAFEVVDFDDLMTGHDRLKLAQHQPHWGVGRHVLGSQIFDYWRDPWGHTLEHWTDGDLLTAADGSNVSNLPELMAVQWGATMPGSHS